MVDIYNDVFRRCRRIGWWHDNTSNMKYRISYLSRKRLLLGLALSLFVLGASIVVNFFSMFLEPPRGDADSRSFVHREMPGDDTIDVYIPGAGFSGFFYTLGRLQALHDAPSRSSPPLFDYYCFSAGCLALVTSLLGLPIDSAIEIAHSSRDRWMTGEIGRYDVVGHFVDGLLFHAEEKVASEDGRLYVMMDGGSTTGLKHQSNTTREIAINSTQYPSDRDGDFLERHLPRINVITSRWCNRHIFSQSVQKPSSVKHLRRLLVQTTWM